ncbi:hypothetical protein NQZ79_g4576 [Umbelopsis isabellina]|nr:hypothetical protein NQZ79_g4576 [Umbelopsis isabellina]
MAQLVATSQLRAPVAVRRIIRILTDPYFLSFAVPVCLTGTVYGFWKLYWKRRVADMEGKAVSRSYTPTSHHDTQGHFDLLIKSYPTGAVSSYVATLEVGDAVGIKGPRGAFTYTPGMVRELGMIAGGTGITPMLQIARAILSNPKDRTKVSLIFANRKEEDILLKDELDNLAKVHNNFQVHYVLEYPPDDWTGQAGFVSKDMIERYLPPPAKDIKILLCGPPAMIKAMTNLTQDIGYEPSRASTLQAMLRFTSANVRRALRVKPRAATAYSAQLYRSSIPTVAFAVRRYATESAGQVETKGKTKVVQYTVDKYPGYERDSRFKKLTAEDVDHFKSIVGETGMIHDNEDDLLAVVPQGGNTGLVGGSIPVFDEIVLSTANLNNIRSFDAVSGICSVQRSVLVSDSGCVLENLDNYLHEKGYIMPIDLGAKGRQVCHIGGNVATNAGGLRLLRYGSLHGTVLGLEVVLPDGTILENLSTLRKDNTGYDLKQLFIGSEGTLGIITGVSILTPRKPNAVNVALLGVNSFEDVQKAFKQAKSEVSEILSAFEFWDSKASKMFKKHSELKDALSDEYPFYVLIETSGSSKDHDDEKLNGLLENLMTDEVALDGVVAQDDTQIRNLWSMREGIPEALSKEGGVFKYDVSLPVPRIYDCVEDMRKHLTDNGVFGKEDSPVVEVVGYGHVGDGNLHLNIATKTVDTKIMNIIEPYIFEWVSKENGSISAEHGLGLQKGNFLHYSKPSAMINLMKTVKQTIDPKGIMNPYKYLPN